jgi:hypothetical protein
MTWAYLEINNSSTQLLLSDLLYTGGRNKDYFNVTGTVCRRSVDYSGTCNSYVHSVYMRCIFVYSIVEGGKI